MRDNRCSCCASPWLKCPPPKPQVSDCSPEDAVDTRGGAGCPQARLHLPLARASTLPFIIIIHHPFTTPRTCLRQGLQHLRATKRHTRPFLGAYMARTQAKPARSDGERCVHTGMRFSRATGVALLLRPSLRPLCRSPSPSRHSSSRDTSRGRGSTPRCRRAGPWSRPGFLI